MILRCGCLVLATVAAGAGINAASYALLTVAVVLAAVALGPDAVWKLAERWWTRERCSGGAAVPVPLVAGLGAAAALLSLLTVTLTWHDTYSTTGVLLWLAALGCLLVLGPLLDGLGLDGARQIGRAAFDPRHRPEIASVVGITLIAFVLRAYEVEAYPPVVHGDEGEMGLIALEIMAGRRYPVFTTAPFWGLPYVFNYLQAGAMWLFGPTVFVLRMLSVIVGTACVPVVYLIARIGWGPAAGATAAWLISVSHLHIHYSRMGVIFIESVLAMAVMMLLLGLAYERGRPRKPAPGESAAGASVAARPAGLWSLLIAAGLVAGLAQYFYFASRVVPIVAAPLLLYLWRTRRISFWQAASFGFAALVVYAPLASHYLYRPDQFAGRLQAVSAFQEGYYRSVVGPDATLPWAAPALIVEQFRRVVSLFVASGDGGGFYFVNVPGFDPVTATMLWLGMGAALARVWRFHELALLIWFWLGVLFGGVFTIDAPSGQRLLIGVTSVYLFGGVLVARVVGLARGLQVRRAERLAVPLGTTLALWLVAANVTIYFYEYAPRASSIEATVVARELLQEPDRYRAYLLTDPVFFPNHGTVRFIARGVEAVNLKSAADFRPPPDDGLGLVVVALQHRLSDLKEIEARVPGGTETPFHDPVGRLIYVAYRVPPR